MAQNKIINFNNPAAVRETAQEFVNKTNEAKVEQRSMFEELLNQIEKINPELGGFEEISALLTLPDEQFALIAPIFLEELQKSLNNTEDKLMLIQAMNVSGTKLEDLRQSYNELAEAIDTQFADVVSPIKRDFLKQMVGLTYNCISDAEPSDGNRYLCFDCGYSRISGA